MDGPSMALHSRRLTPPTYGPHRTLAPHAGSGVETFLAQTRATLKGGKNHPTMRLSWTGEQLGSWRRTGQDRQYEGESDTLLCRAHNVVRKLSGAIREYNKACSVHEREKKGERERERPLL